MNLKAVMMPLILISAVQAVSASAQTRTEILTAKNAALVWDKNFSAGGLAQLNSTIQDCYGTLKAKPSLAAIQYCFSLDFETSDVDRYIMKNLKGTEINMLEFNRIENVNDRANKAFDLLGLNYDSRGEKISLWIDLASRALNEVAAKKPPAKQ